MRIERDLIIHSNMLERAGGVTADNISVMAWVDHLEHRGLEQIDLPIVLSLHQAIMQGQETIDESMKGVLRGPECQVNVKTENYTFPIWEFVPGLVDEWLHAYKDMQPLDAHIVFEKIHPFADGNGRVGRMLLWHQQLAVGEEPMQVGLYNSDEYYALFS